MNQANAELLEFEEELEKKGRLDIVRLDNSRQKVSNFYNTTFKGMIKKPFEEEVQEYYGGVRKLIYKACIFSEKKE